MRKRDKDRIYKLYDKQIADKIINSTNGIPMERKPYSRYKIRITVETKDNDSLVYFAENPEKGDLVGTWYIHDPRELEALGELEGLFYQIWNVKTGDLIGKGVFDESVWEEIRYDENINEVPCCRVCELCFQRNDFKWHGHSALRCERELLFKNNDPSDMWFRNVYGITEKDAQNKLDDDEIFFAPTEEKGR